jgi:citrate synthase
MLQSICQKMQTACQIDPALFEKYNVKRGLRNADHTGVLVGLTSIGDVVGYRIEDERPFRLKGSCFTVGIGWMIWFKGFRSKSAMVSRKSAICF